MDRGTPRPAFDRAAVAVAAARDRIEYPRGRAMILFHFDYIDPLSFLVELRLATLAGGRVDPESMTDAIRTLPVDRHPFEILPPPSPLLRPDDPELRSRRERAVPVFREHGLELVRPEVVPWSRKAHELGFVALEHGRFPEVHLTLLRAHHLEGRDIGRVDVLVEVAEEAGLERSAAKAALDVDRWTERVATLRRGAERRGIRGVPTLRGASGELTGAPDPASLREMLRGE